MAFIPFDASDSERAQLTVLRTDVTTGLRYELITWMLERTQSNGSFVNGRLYGELATALDLDWGVTGTLLRRENAKNFLTALDGRKLLHAVDYLLSKGYSYEVVVQAALDRARSAFTLRQDGGRAHRLTHRAPEAVLSALRAQEARDGAAGRLLTQAWNKAFDLSPDDSAAYMHAVQAVEAAGIAALHIENPEATLGSVIRTLEKDSAWGLPFIREHAAASTNETLLYMLRSLWRGHRDRHGSDAWEGVTHEETETAVYLALSLVGLFDARLVRHRTLQPASPREQGSDNR